MTKIVKTDHAAALGSHGLVRDWALLTHAQTALEQGGLEGLARFYRASVEQPGSRAIWIRATLEAHGRKTLASEYDRFMALYRDATRRE